MALLSLVRGTIGGISAAMLEPRIWNRPSSGHACEASGAHCERSRDRDRHEGVREEADAGGEHGVG